MGAPRVRRTALTRWARGSGGAARTLGARAVAFALGLRSAALLLLLWVLAWSGLSEQLERLGGNASRSLGFAAHFEHEATDQAGARLAPFHARLAHGDREPELCSRHPDVTEPAFLLDVARAVADRALMG